MTFGAVFPRVLRPAFGPGLAPAAPPAGGWWDVSGKTCVAAYQPKGAASLSASYTNLANPGTYDAAPGVAPSWASATGWTFSGAQYLDTGVIAAGDQSWSLIVSHANTIFNDGCWLGNYRTTGDAAFMAQGQVYIERGWLYNGLGYPNVLVTASAVGTTGVLGVAGRYGYVNGVAETATIPANPATAAMRSMYLGAINYHTDTDAPGYYLTGQILAAVIYSDTLTAGEVATVSAAMAALTG